MRRDGLAQPPIIAGVAKQIAHLYRQIAQRFREGAVVMDDAIEEIGDRLASKRDLRPRHAASQRGARIAAEILLVEAVDRLEQQIELDLGLCVGVESDHFGIQTRISDSSFSTSIGLEI